MATTRDNPHSAAIGKGWAFPMQMTVQGGLKFSQAEQSIEESIFIVLSTRLGERVYRPEFGSQLHELVFAPLNDETLLLARVYAFDAIKKWEPRIQIESVTAAPAPEAASLNITVHYRLRNHPHRRSLNHHAQIGVLAPPVGKRKMVPIKIGTPLSAPGGLFD